MSLRGLIAYAYGIEDYQILGAPEFARTDRFDIAAKPSAADALREPPRYSPAADQLSRQRTQALLAERFHLKVHNEDKEMSVYSLVVAKGGAKLQTSTSDSPFPQMSWNSVRVQCKKVTLARFAKVILATRLRRYVIDNTGLTGEYDFHMEFEPDPPAPKDGAIDLRPAGRSFDDALQQQLGLRLITAKGPVPFLIVDHVEKPTAN